jgi:hypothetical protein
LTSVHIYTCIYIIGAVPAEGAVVTDAEGMCVCSVFIYICVCLYVEIYIYVYVYSYACI